MAFEDVAKRMKENRGSTRAERLHEIWHGEPAPIEPLVPELEPVPPAARKKTVVFGYALMFIGMLVAAVAAIAAVVFFTALSRWEFRGVVILGAVGMSMIVHGASRLEAADKTAPLPRADLHN